MGTKNSALQLTAVVAVLAIVLCGTAQAMPEEKYFAQDDFTLTFGVFGEPGSPGTDLDCTGRILHWSADQIAGWFEMSGVSSLGAIPIGSDLWQMNFDQNATLKITAPSGGTILWQGSISDPGDCFYVVGKTDHTWFDATAYDRPFYEQQPSLFEVVGGARFTRTGGTWSDPHLGLGWLGAYNINFDGDTPDDSSFFVGNVQGKLVPEPGALLSLFSGGVGIASIISRRRRQQA